MGLETEKAMGLEKWQSVRDILKSNQPYIRICRKDQDKQRKFIYSSMPFKSTSLSPYVERKPDSNKKIFRKKVFSSLF